MDSLLNWWRQRKDIRERAAIAKAFNDRYVSRERFEEETEVRVPGTTMWGMEGFPAYNRWMCPKCNHIHAPVEINAFTGLQYPGCCSIPSGPRWQCS